MKVFELVDHLKTLNQNLDVWYLSEQEYGYPATSNEAREYDLEEPETGKQLKVCLIGEIP